MAVVENTGKRKDRILAGKTILKWLFIGLLVSVFAMPQYWSVSVGGFDLTVQRFLLCVVMVCVFCDSEARSLFSTYRFPLLLLGVLSALILIMAINALWNRDIGSVAQVLFDNVIPTMLFLFAARYIFTRDEVVDILVRILFFVCLFAIVDGVFKKNIYTIIHASDVVTSGVPSGSGWRMGQYRVAAMCSHPIGLGLYLILMTPVACYSSRKNRIDVLCRPLLMGMILLCILLTGSRMSQAAWVGEVFILFLLTDKQRQRVIIPYILIGLALLSVLLFLFRDEEHVRRIVLLNIAQVVDEIFGTEFTSSFGVHRAAVLQSSNDYRDYLPLVFFSEQFDPLIGIGQSGSDTSSGKFGFWIEDRWIVSIDNFYVLQYIRYAWPGVVAIAFVFFYFAISAVFRWKHDRRMKIALSLSVGFVVYFAALWFVADLGTFKYLFGLYGLFLWSDDSRKVDDCGTECDS